MKESLEKLRHNSTVRRVVMIIVTSFAILSTAASCSLPGIPQIQPPGSDQILGVLKKQPEKDFFVKANAVERNEGDPNIDGLTEASTTKIARADKDTFYISTIGKGLYKSENGGILWDRKFVLDTSSTKEDERERNEEILEKVQRDSSFKIRDILVNPTDKSIIYVSGNLEDIGKIYKSKDGGDSFDEIYTESEEKTDVRFLEIDENNPRIVFAGLEQNAIIKSEDAGRTWKRLGLFDDDIVDLDFSPEFDNSLVVGLQENGIAVSADYGETWEIRRFLRSQTPDGNYEPGSDLQRAYDSVYPEKSATGLINSRLKGKSKYLDEYEQVLVVSPSARKDAQGSFTQAPWIVIAEGEIWISENIFTQPLRQVFLPVEDTEYDLLDVEYDPILGIDRIIVSVDNKLYESKDRGITWEANDKVRLQEEIGNISQILIDEEDNEVVYLTLVKDSLRRVRGLINF